MSDQDPNAAVAGSVEHPVRPVDHQRAAFETFVRDSGLDLDCRYMYDDRGNYCYDGYVWQDTADAFRLWQAAFSVGVYAERERCAKVCEQVPSFTKTQCEYFAAAVRGLGPNAAVTGQTRENKGQTDEQDT